MLSIFKDRSLYKNLLLAVVTLALLFVGWLKCLNYYTLHDNFIKVPDFNNMQITKLSFMAKEARSLLVVTRNRESEFICDCTINELLIL